MSRRSSGTARDPSTKSGDRRQSGRCFGFGQVLVEEARVDRTQGLQIAFIQNVEVVRMLGLQAGLPIVTAGGVVELSTLVAVVRKAGSGRDSPRA